MPVSISSSFSSQAFSASIAAEPVQKAAQPTGDTIKLSQAAQIHQLKQQGQGPSQIASSLGVTVAVVDGYLGVAVPAVSSTASVTLKTA